MSSSGSKNHCDFRSTTLIYAKSVFINIDTGKAVVEDSLKRNPYIFGFPYKQVVESDEV
jgi:hypothetical protein